MLKDSLIRQPTEEDPDEGIKDLVEIALKKMVLLCVRFRTCIWNILPLLSLKYMYLYFFRIMTMMEEFLIQILRRQSQMKTFYQKLLATASQIRRQKSQLFLHVKCIVILKRRALTFFYLLFVWQRILLFEQHAFQEPHEH